MKFSIVTVSKLIVLGVAVPLLIWQNGSLARNFKGNDQPLIWQLDDDIENEPQFRGEQKNNKKSSSNAYLFSFDNDIAQNEEPSSDDAAADAANPPADDENSSSTEQPSIPEQSGTVRRVITIQNNPTANAPSAAPSTNTQASSAVAPTPAATNDKTTTSNTVFLRLSDVAASEFIRIVSNATNRNFIFDEIDLDFNVSIISEEPTTIENLMTMLLQELRIHGLSLIEQGNNFIIHKNNKVNSISHVVDDFEQGNEPLPAGVEIITEIFRLNTLNLSHAIDILTPLASTSAIIEGVADGNQIIITDLTSNVVQMKKLLRAIDAPKGGLVVGQYVSKNTPLETLISLAEKILLPMSKEQPLVFVPHTAAGSIFVIASPFFVERSLAILEHIDQTQGETGIYDEQARKVQLPEIKPAENFPSGRDLQYAQESSWSDINGRKAFRPKLLPGESGEHPPAGRWLRDNEGRLIFEPSPTGSLGGTPRGARVTGGQWITGSNGEWIYEGGDRPQLPASGLPPMGTWYRDETGAFHFEDAKNYLNPQEGRPPVGAWVKNEEGKWFFDLSSNYDSPKGGLPPLGKWVKDEGGNWQFQRSNQGTRGGFPQQTMWVHTAEGMWGVIPSSIPDAERGTFPEGIWRYNEEDGSWQFLEGRNFSIPSGMPPSGAWVKNANGNWEFVRTKEGPAGGVPYEGYWTIDENGYWRYIVDDKGFSSTYPLGYWLRDSKNNWKFQEVRLEDMTPGGLAANASWVRDAEGNWSVMPGSNSGLPEGKWNLKDSKWVFTPGKTANLEGPPSGRWQIVDGKWQFIDDSNALPGGVEGGGIWTIDENGNWRYIGKDGKNPVGFWRKNQKGEWAFQLFNKDGFSAGGAGANASWIIDAEGNWSLMPGTAPEGIPAGLWQFANQKWQFWEGRKPNLPNGLPPIGRWMPNDENVLQFVPGPEAGTFPGGGAWVNEKRGWRFNPMGKAPQGAASLAGIWTPSDQGWGFVRDNEKWTIPPGGVEPPGTWVRDDTGQWVFVLDPNQNIQSRKLLRPEPTTVELPLGHIERTQFYIYKLQYRNGDQIQDALKRIAESLYASGVTNEELISAINSAQWLSASNSIVFTGTNDALRKVRELIEELDRPLRQIFLDMLIMQVGVDDSLEYGVTWASAFGSPNTGGAQTFDNGATNPIGMITGIQNNAVVTPVPTSGVGNPPLSGYTLGVVGQTILHNGTSFGSLAAVVRAQHDNDTADVLMNPKILTEDNATAEIFVGITQPFKTQSISNDQGSTITTSFDFRDVGTSLKVTPIIGDNDIITLEIHQEVSQAEATAGATGNVNVDPPPTISKITATTRVHVPNNFFLVISGMIQDTLTTTRSQVPCLGGIPVLGALFGRKVRSDSKRNLMIFINPRIIDTDEDIINITKHEQDIYRIKRKMKGSWRFEVDEALDFLNIRSVDQTSFHDKMMAPSCTTDAELVDDEDVDDIDCYPCDEISTRAWRTNRRLYH